MCPKVLSAEWQVVVWDSNSGACGSICSAEPVTVGPFLEMTALSAVPCSPALPGTPVFWLIQLFSDPFKGFSLHPSTNGTRFTYLICHFC